MSFAVGSLVKARGREWVVLPESSDDILQVRPLGGTDIEASSILPSLESVESASFSPPDPDNVGDARSARLLRDAVRIGFRSSAGPFRSLASIAVEPRPYQLVPLLMALRLEPIRLLVADDVGIGKTVEVSLIAKEMLARGEINRLCVLCPPHLAEQWQTELSRKFNLNAALVLPSTVSKLERECRMGESVFDHFPATIVSVDYIKQERRRDDFLRTCPNFVIVDEAHTCSDGGQASQQRFQLLTRLAATPNRHLVLVTATPHSGNDLAFRSLLSLLNPTFRDLPEELGGEQNRKYREQLAMHFVQRRRADVSKHFIEDTPFPKRLETELTYKLHPDYRKLLDSAVQIARESVLDESGTKFQRRIRWWSALALLRSISSSPAAAISTLRSRAQAADSDDLRVIEELGRRSVLDLTEAEEVEGFDVSPGADTDSQDSPTRRKLLALARQAEALRGPKDHKLQAISRLITELVAEGNSPIVFCKYIPTAEYIADHLRAAHKGTDVACVTGQLPHGEREERVLALAECERRVLVCTDCLSEGINLQEYFDAVVHADLAWSPTRHEQREGRVDRFNQKSEGVRIVTTYGEDNPVDGIVFQILLRKHKTIRNSLGISVPVPADSEKVLEAIFEALLMKGERAFQPSLFTDHEFEEQKELNLEWERAADRERRNRAIFAQNAIKVEEVQKELDDVRDVLGSALDVETFFRETVKMAGGRCENAPTFELDLSSCPRPLREAVGLSTPVHASFSMPSPRGAIQLSRTHSIVERLAAYVFDSALAGDQSLANRCGVIATDAVSEMTSLITLRLRFQIGTQRGDLLAEDATVVAFSGIPSAAAWLKPGTAEALLGAVPRGNLTPDIQRHILRTILSELHVLRVHFQEIARMRGEKLLESHRRIRRAIDGTSVAKDVRLQGQPDVLGLTVLMPFEGRE